MGLERMCTIDGHCKVQREVFQVPSIMLQKDKALVELRVKRRKIVKKAWLAEPL